MNQTVNADPAELAKFSELAMRWWDPDSEFKPLHQINPLRLEWINGYTPLNGQTVLDVLPRIRDWNEYLDRLEAALREDAPAFAAPSRIAITANARRDEA